MLKQRLSQKLLQKLSPQQIQLMKLLLVPTATLQQRIKEELEANPALEEGEEDEVLNEEQEDEDVESDDDTVIDLAFQSESDNEDFPDGTFMVNEQDKQKILDRVKSERFTTIPTLVDSSNREFQINNNHFTIGKSVGNNLKVKGFFIKNLHANIVKLNPRTYKIISYGSFLAPTKVNGASIRQKVLYNGDVIEVGNAKMVYQH